MPTQDITRQQDEPGSHRVWAWLALSGFVLFSLVYVVRYFIEQSQSLHESVQISLTAALVIICIYCTYWFSAVISWQVIVAHVSGRQPGLTNSFIHLALLSVGKYLPGKIWGVAARTARMKLENIAASDALIATCYEQLATVHSAVLVCALVTLTLVPGLVSVLLALAAAASLFVIPFIEAKALPALGRFMRRADDDAIYSRSIPARKYLFFVLLYSVVWLFNGLVFAGVYLAFVSPALSAGILLFLVLANTVSIVTGFFALFAPAGIGVREGVSVAIMSPVIGWEQALLLALLFRLWSVAGELCVAMFALLLGLRNRHTQASGQDDS